MLTESDIAQIPFAWFVQTNIDRSDFKTGLIFGHFDRNFRAIGLRKPRLVFQTGGNGTVTDFVCVAEFVELEQLRRQRLASRVALTFILVDADLELSRHGERLPYGHALSAGASHFLMVTGAAGGPERLFKL
jgi:hypothetical protein